MTNKEAIERLKEGAPFSEMYNKEWEEAVSLAIQALEEKPTGEWIELSDDNLDVRMKCSACGTAETPFARYKFCPNCGVRMRRSYT